MNMGGPGDHWYTDLFSWDRPAFGEPTDALVREIRRLGGDPLLRDGPLAQRLGRLWPRYSDVDDRALRDLGAELAAVRDELRAEAVAGGWEVEQTIAPVAPSPTPTERGS